MSSFGDGNIKTDIEADLHDIFREYYDNTVEGQRQFILDVMDVVRYIVGEW